MKTDRFTYEGVPTPCYIIEEDLLRRNLELIRDVSRRAGVEIILAFKAFFMEIVPCFQEYISHTTASSSTRPVWRRKSSVARHILILRRIRNVISTGYSRAAVMSRSIP